MNCNFSKYSGSGNDFILIDCRSKIFPYTQPGIIQKLCSRPTGIGADGVIYEKDLGAKTDAVGKAMKDYDPDSTWSKTPMQ